MTNDDVLAVASAFIFHYTHLAAERCADGIADIDLDVQSFVLAAPAGTEVACHHAAGCGHTEMAKIYAERVGHLSGTMGVAIGPIVVELCCR